MRKPFMNKIIAFFTLAFIATISIAQYDKVDLSKLNKIGEQQLTNPIVDVPLFCVANASNKEDGLYFQVTNLKRDHEVPNKKELERIKLEKNASKFNVAFKNKAQKATGALTPVIERNFAGTDMVNGTPPDNSMAISNSGIIVSADNNSLRIVQDNGTVLQPGITYANFFANPNLNGGFSDPRVIYDSAADRWIFTILHIGTTSELVVAFSATNNPLTTWNTYILSGDPAFNTRFFDYPSAGISQNELYISGNIFGQGGFDECIVYQIDKSDGYSGQGLTNTFWDNIPGAPFTIVPLTWGQQGGYGPGIYMIAGNAGGGNIIDFYDITDDLSGSPQLTSFSIPIQNYQPGGDAAQSNNNSFLLTNDSRIHDGFYMNGVAHFVFMSDIGGGWNGINYCRFHLADNVIVRETTGEQNVRDHAFPTVSSIGQDIDDQSVIVGFLSSGSSGFPSFRTFAVDHFNNISNLLQVKPGDNFVNIVQGDERWGDYSGACRRYNSNPPKVWIHGCYGGQTVQTFNGYKSWIAEIGASGFTDIPKNEIMESSVFPNPTIDLINIDFNIPTKQVLRIALLDVTGKEVRELYNGYVKSGPNRMSFNGNALANGTYFLNVQSNEKSLLNEKIIVAK